MFNKRDHGHLSEKELMFLMFDFLISKIESLMTKQEFLDFIASVKGELSTISDKVGALEDKINNSPTDVDPDIVAAVQDLKGSVDALNAKADNTPPATDNGDSQPTEPAQ
jgi:hypothetical protein